MFIETKGHFGRQARFADGPQAQIGCVHPITLQFMRLPSTTDRHKLHQYLFSPGVNSTSWGADLPTAATKFLSPTERRCTLCFGYPNGDALLVVTRRRASGEVKLLSSEHRLWLVDRGRDDIDTHAVLNANLLTVAQSLVSHASQPLVPELYAVSGALKCARRASFGELARHLRVVGMDARTRLKVVLFRLMAAKRLSLSLAEAPMDDSMRIRWGRSGTGYVPPGLDRAYGEGEQ